MKFKILASLLVLAVVAALVIVFGAGQGPSNSPAQGASAPEFGADAVNSLRQ